MVLTLVLGPNKNYQRIFTAANEVSIVFSEMHGNLNPEKLITSLGSSVAFVSATSCRAYGAAVPLNVTGRTDNIQGDVVDFFKQVEDYAEKHKADYVLIQDFNFEMNRHSRKISGIVQLLLEENR